MSWFIPVVNVKMRFEPSLNSEPLGDECAVQVSIDFHYFLKGFLVTTGITYF